MLKLQRKPLGQTHYLEPQPVEFINPIAASCSSHQGFAIAEGYRYLVKFFGSALLDRTETLQPGFPYRILDPIPLMGAEVPDLAALCDARGREIMLEAQQKDCPVNMLWSGGIDSTAALVSLLKAAQEYREYDRLHIYYSRASVGEYKQFFRQLIKPRLRRTRIKNVAEALAPQTLIVTGEHGDQLFGSVLAANYLQEPNWFRSEDQRLFMPWQQVLRPVLEAALDNFSQADQAYDFLQPQLQQAPIPLHSLFDVLWWVNFSMKWQSVSLRLATHKPEQYAAVRQALRHFFRSDDFQRWSLSHHEQKIGTDWASYKMPLKRYIHAYFPDRDYLDKKLKVPSLGRITKHPKARIYDRELGAVLSIEQGVGDACADSDGE